MTTTLLLVLGAAALPRDRWAPRLGDPSLIAWVCVATYLATMALCFRARQRARPGQEQHLRTFWLGLSLCLAFLALNKELDLHVLLIQTGRDLAGADGWLQHRRIVLGAFLAALGVVGAGAVILVLRRLRPAGREVYLALVGFASLMGFLLLRVSPLEPISKLLTIHIFTEEDGFAHVHLSELLELVNLAIIAAGAWCFARRPLHVPGEWPPTNETQR
ncbi:MAG: hypothetical protein HYY24_07880 [Verrucomicrobia bacterium]|nr:hypothetical protein [Verrucomicrobiota bacterium]